MSFRIKPFSVMCGLALLALGCGQKPALALAAPVTAEAAQDVGQAYRLGSGDQVQITTFGEPSLSGVFPVSGSGMVAIPLAGEVRAEGLTTVEFGHAVEGALRDGFLNDPKVSVDVLTYRPFYILGEVTRPGEYPYTNGLTVLNAVATANGFTYRANTHHVFIKRANDPTEHKIDLTPQTAVQPGDTVVIKERYF